MVGTRTLWVLGGLLVLALAGGLATMLLGRSSTPDAVRDLEEARRAGESARSQSERIARALERIAANLEQGEGISQSTSEIDRLTERQRSSLGAVAGILRRQLAALERTEGSLDDTRRAADDVARISQRQTALLRRAVAALRRIENATRTSGRFSASVAVRARYAARLAEDSADAFSGR